MNLFWDEEVPYMTIFDEHHMTYTLLMGVLLLLMVAQVEKVKKHAEIIRKGILMVSIIQQVALYSCVCQYFLGN